MNKPLLLFIALLFPLLASAQAVSIGDILCTDGTTVKPSAYLSSGKTAEGIVFYVDQSGQEGWAVNLHRDAIDIHWVTPEYYEYGYDIPLLPNCETSRQGLFDLDGYSNTAIIRMTHGPEWYPAAWCVDFDNGWYLPAAGQMRWLLSYVNEMNESLAIVNGEPFQLPYPDWHWTSTEMSAYHAKFISRIGTVSNYMKYNYINQYTIGVRSIRDFSCHSTPNHKIGDLVTAPGGQQGIIYHVSPDDQSYWLVALNDLPQQYPWGPNIDLPELENIGEEWYKLHGEYNGCEATMAMRDAQGASPSYPANQVDLDNGWHIPSSGELSKLYAAIPFIQNSILQNGGTVPDGGQYWSSTESSAHEAWAIDFGEVPDREGMLATFSKNTTQKIRPIWSQPCSATPPPPDPTLEPSILVYPNPTKGKFEILLNGIEGNTTIEIFNYLGQLIDRFEVQSLIDGYVLPYSLTGKAAGIYLISITNGHDRYYQKLTKNYAGDYGTYY